MVQQKKKFLSGVIVAVLILAGCGGGGAEGVVAGVAPATISSETPENRVVSSINSSPASIEEVATEIVIPANTTDEQTLPTPDPSVLYVAKGNPNASDSNDGTLDSPLATLEAAFEKANALSNSVTLFVSAESYLLQHSLTMDKVIEIDGGYLPDFSALSGSKTEFLFQNVDDPVLIHLKWSANGGTLVPVNSFKNLLINAPDKTDFYYALSAPREGSSLFNSFSLINCEVHGNILLGSWMPLNAIEIRNNRIYGSNGGISGGASSNNRYNDVVIIFSLSPMTHILDNVISGGDIVGTFSVRAQSLLYFPSVGISFGNPENFEVIIENNSFTCGRVQSCYGITENSALRDAEQVAPIIIRRNTFRGSDFSDNQSYTALNTGTMWGHVEFVENEVYFPKVATLTGVSIWSASDNGNSPYYKLENNLFSLSGSGGGEESMTGIGLSDVVGRIDILNNRFDMPEEAVKVSRWIFPDGNPEEALTLDSDVPVVVRRF